MRRSRTVTPELTSDEIRTESQPPADGDGDSLDLAQLADELQKENEAYQRQIQSLEADDPKAELVRLNMHLDQLNGRLQGEITTRNEAQKMVKHYAGLLERTSYPALLDAWIEIVSGKAALRTWPADVSPKKVARLSLDHWLNDVCPACSGRCYETVRGQPTVLSDFACRACAGQGTRAVQVQHKLQRLVEDMVEALNAMTAHAAGQTMKRLSRELDF